MADASPPDRDGWQSVPVDPAVLAARVAGLSYGFLVFDDTGSEWTRQGDRFQLRIFPNRFVYSRDQNRASAPYFTVELGPEDREPPAAPTSLTSESRDLPPGEAIVSWVTPRDQGPAGTLGFVATLDGRAIPRELIPLAGLPGTRVEMHLRDLGLENAPPADGERAGRGRGRQPRPGGDGNGPVSGQARSDRCRDQHPEIAQRACRDAIAPPGRR